MVDSKIMILILKIIGLMVLLYVNHAGIYPSFLTEVGRYYFEILIRFIIFFIFLDFVQKIIGFYYQIKTGKKGVNNISAGIKQIYSLTLVLGFIGFALSLLQVKMEHLLTTLSLVAAALAIITKDYISNLINGMIITFSNQISIGDQVKIGSNEGKIIDMTLMNIKLVNDDDDIIFITNNNAFAANITNYTRREIKKTSIPFSIKLEYLDSVEKLEQELKNTMEEFKEKIQENSMQLKVEDIQKDVVDLKFQYILNFQDNSLERQIKRRTIRRVISIIKEKENIDHS
jgi:small-conductance mechanosensitive channel